MDTGVRNTGLDPSAWNCHWKNLLAGVLVEVCLSCHLLPVLGMETWPNSLGPAEETLSDWRFDWHPASSLSRSGQFEHLREDALESTLEYALHSALRSAPSVGQLAVFAAGSRARKSSQNETISRAQLRLGESAHLREKLVNCRPIPLLSPEASSLAFDLCVLLSTHWEAANASLPRYLFKFWCCKAGRFGFGGRIRFGDFALNVCTCWLAPVTGKGGSLAMPCTAQ